MSETNLEGLRERVRAATGWDNALDIAIEIALFVPDERHVDVRVNSAGTKLVYRRHDGDTDTHWAREWTLEQANRNDADALLSALIAQQVEAS